MTEAQKFGNFWTVHKLDKEFRHLNLMKALNDWRARYWNQARFRKMPKLTHSMSLWQPCEIWTFC